MIMTKVLLEQVGKKSLKEYKKNVAEISRIAFSGRTKDVHQIEMYSKQDLISKVQRKNSF